MKLKNIIIGITCLASAPFITGGAGWNVPPCDSEAVIESSLILASAKFNVDQNSIKLKNIQNIKLKGKKSRTCVAEVVNKKTGKYVDDFYYQVLVTHGISWIVTSID